MAPELFRAQIPCVTPSPTFYQTGLTPERTGVSTDDHGWAKYSGTTGAALGPPDIELNEPTSSATVGWTLGYYFTNGQPRDGQYEEVIRHFVLVGVAKKTFALRLYNVSGTYKFRLWNVDTDAQLGSDSSAVTVGQTMLINIRSDASANTIEAYLDGVSQASGSFTHDNFQGGLSCGVASTGTTRFWSAWCNYSSSSDDLNEAHYPEMRLLHPDGVGTHSDYQDSGGGAADPLEWDDLAASGEPDGDTTWNAGQDATEQETHTLTTHTMSNTIQAVAELLSLRDDQADKGVVHGAIIRVGSADKVLSYGQEDLPETYVVREAVFHTEPSTGTWTQALVDGMEAGHRRDAGTAALNVRVTALGVVVVALGTTNLAPPDPPVTPDSGAIPRTSGVSLGSANAMIV